MAFNKLCQTLKHKFKDFYKVSASFHTTNQFASNNKNTEKFNPINRHYLPEKNSVLLTWVNYGSPSYLNILRTYCDQAVEKTKDTKGKRCWKCGKKLNIDENQYFCVKCGVIQAPVEEKNYFEMLGMKAEFDIDTRLLTDTFRKLQANLHPDKFSKASDTEKQLSELQSSLVNTAYQTLLKPLPRGLYLLKLKKDPILEEEIHLGSKFLMDIMELNEELDEVIEMKALEDIWSDNDQKINTLVQEIGSAFRIKEYTVAKGKLAELQYYVSLEDKLKKKKASLSS